MERLVQSKLFGAGLVSVDTPVLVRRYNECLIELGIQATDLERFSIDGLGWSPEIARERNDPYYLSAGVCNPMGIIITPNQRNKPLYFPYHSYDRVLLDQYFSRFRGEIADVTSSRGIALDIDHQLTSYSSPADLRLVTYAVVSSSTGELGETATRQRKLIAKITAEGLGWTDATLRDDLRSSAQQYGDLRCRTISIPDFRFDDLTTFYTRAFGGVFVIQTLDAREKLLFVEDESVLVRDGGGKHDMCAAHEPAAVALLEREQLLEINLSWYQTYPQVLAYIKDCLAAEILCFEDEGVRFSELTPMQKKQRMAASHATGIAVFGELERLMKRLQGGSVPRPESLSAELRLLLLRPNRNLPLQVQLVLRQFLHRLIQVDIIQLYADDKNFFFERYRQWPESKRAWAVDKISDDYILASDDDPPAVSLRQ